MPDPGRPGEEFERNVEIALPSVSHLNILKFSSWTPRGFSLYQNYKKYTVNFRPKNWPDENFWIGKIANAVDAKFISDACFHYLGQAPIHFPNATFSYPALECPGTTTPLTSFEMCLKYVNSIARGTEKRHLRKKYREAVRALVTELVKTDAVQTVLQQFRESNPAPVVTTGPIAHVPSFNPSESGLESESTSVEDDRSANLRADEEECCSSTRRVPEDEDSGDFNTFWTTFFATRDASEY